MTTNESLERHQAFNEVLKLMNSNKDFMNFGLFDEVVKLALNQQEETKKTINLELSSSCRLFNNVTKN